MDQPLTPHIRYTATLKERIHEYEDVYTFIFERPLGLTFVSGNYVHVHIPHVVAPDRSVREISFASAPQDTDIAFSITTKSQSPWQTHLLALTPNDTVELFKIKGHLITPYSGTLVMIAQGVGVTPFRSIIQEHVATGTAITPILIHICKEQYLYEQELLPYSFEQHRIVREDLEKVLSDIVTKNTHATFMIAGSPMFVESTHASLQDKGVPPTMIQTDAFKGLPD